jgi:hypothetical protein
VSWIRLCIHPQTPLIGIRRRKLSDDLPSGPFMDPQTLTYLQECCPVHSHPKDFPIPLGFTIDHRLPPFAGDGDLARCIAAAFGRLRNL